MKNFDVAAYIHAEYLYKADEKSIEEGIQFFKKYITLNKVYLETHRGLYDIPKEKMARVKKIFLENGIHVSGGITSTIKIDGHEKNSIFDVFCFSDPVYREKYLEIIRDTAGQFDEIILDDFFFTACRCGMCIEKKGQKSWAQFRLEQMEEMAREIVDLCHEVNPNCNFIIKYPNWYESYQECGYNPEKQRDIFDGIYTGTESRNPQYDQQHIQRYLSYSLIRLMENIAPGKNLGGWIDQGASWDNLNVWLEQAALTVFAKSKELMLFNFSELLETAALPPLGVMLERIDHILDSTGNPSGTSTYEPFNADGEDQLMNYVGMLGTALEPEPEFNSKEPVIFLTASAACDDMIIQKLEKYIAEGGTAIITTGFLRETYHRGVKELTSVRLTGRRVSGREYWIDSYYTNHKEFCSGSEKISCEVLDYKTNATWCEIALIDNECNFPLLLDDFYGKGHLLIWNIPDNFADLYKLPKAIIGSINKMFAKNLPVYLENHAKYNLFVYDNDVFGVYSYRPFAEDLTVILRGEKYLGVEDIESKERFMVSGEKIKPQKRFDSAKTESGLTEKIVQIPMTNGMFRFFRLISGN